MVINNFGTGITPILFSACGVFSILNTTSSYVERVHYNINKI